MARAGYDVWLGNNRGTRFSQKHTTLDPKKKPFWVFTWEQMGTKDTPAVIDFILKTTGHDKLSYVGHSEGTTQIMCGAAMLPDFYNSKIKVALLGAPVASMIGGVKLPSSVSMQTAQKVILGVLDTIHLWNILPYDDVHTHASDALCRWFDGFFCNWLYKQFIDITPGIDNGDRFDVYSSNLPSGSSIYNTLHYAQLVNGKEAGFRRWDEGSPAANQKAYGQDTPPDYDLSLLNFPIGIFSGSLDKTADPADVKWLTPRLQKNLIFNHEYHMAH